VNETVWHAEILSVRYREAWVACTAGDRIDTAISDQPVPGGRQWRGDQWRGDPSTKPATITATAWSPVTWPRPIAAISSRVDGCTSWPASPSAALGDRSRFLHSIVHITMMPRDARSSPRSRLLPRE
jgi:hypothetical protein